jgi:superfamily II DNA or RNA helicase
MRLVRASAVALNEESQAVDDENLVFKFTAGSWVFSQDHREPVRILESQSVWNRTTYLVWRPTEEAVVWITADRLTSLDQRKIVKSVDNISYRVAAARVVEGLAEDVLLAPLEAGVIPLPHQLLALSKAMACDRVRYLLADEVGLGKTIEAGLVIRELKLRGLVKRVLIVAPKGLVLQWVQEMRMHFHEQFQLLSPSDFSAIRHLVADDNIWRQFDQVVCPVDAVKPIERRRGWSQERVERHNQERIGDLIAAGWDLIVVDEAHRLGGSTDTVARYKLGKALAEAAPYLLLLSATPHQGKTESFYRLMSLLDQNSFPDIRAIKRENVAPFVIRTEKRKAINDRGEPLFKSRTTRLVPVHWKEKHFTQKQLYDAVTEYVRRGYNQAMRDNRQYLGFLMILMQRLVTSSTRAIATALGRRQDVLTSTTITQDDLSGDEAELLTEDSQEQVEELLAASIAGLHNEREEVKLLLEAANRCQSQGLDARAETLLDLIYRTQQDEINLELKFLIFTEFVPTQQMLSELLEQHGFTIVCLNGSMDLESRQRVQKHFSQDARILVSTDAGGEGLNLQFAHVVINYDLPWNPMRIEQRIGRVDRIGQKHRVRAFNLIFADSVEMRVHEVLEEKLKTIFADFGVDKTGDVLDSAESGAAFEKVYADGILNPERIEESVEKLMKDVRERAEAEREGKSFYDDPALDASLAAKYVNHPMPFWIERMTTAYLRAEGCQVEKKLFAYDLEWPDGERMQDICFFGREAQDQGLSHISLENPKVRSLVERLPRAVAGEQLPRIAVPGLSAQIQGFWSLWRIALMCGGRHIVRILSLFSHDDGRTLLPTARLIWEKLLQDGIKIEDKGYIETSVSNEVFDRLRPEAERHGETLFQSLYAKHQQRIASEREKGRYAFHVRRQALNRIGLPEVRQHRIKLLDEEERNWEADLRQYDQVFPDLQPIVVLRVEASDG